MGARIPRSIREQVIKQWLEGISRDRIAKDNGIGAGTVSSIIKDSMQEITDIDLLRAVALIVKRHELNLPLLASSIRLKKKMDKMGLSEEEVDSLENIDTYCFKRRLTAEQFVNIIDSIFDLL
jgi:transcriptional regulator with XRE-family HTH domain